MSWQDRTGRGDAAGAAAFFEDLGLAVEWGEGGTLSAWNVRPAVARHPRTGAPLWFNLAHMAFPGGPLAPSARVMSPSGRAARAAGPPAGARSVTLAAVPARRRSNPRTPPPPRAGAVTYGDGGAIEDEVVSALQAARFSATRCLRLGAGDVLALDNYRRGARAGPVGARAVCPARLGAVLVAGRGRALQRSLGRGHGALSQLRGSLWDPPLRSPGGTRLASSPPPPTLGRPPPRSYLHGRLPYEGDERLLATVLTSV
jgi:hypothetical protein